ncbi:universal stress family protein [Burkholderia pseudomallei 406e]|nr:universal stress family protein [Burkholderia mallei FMH]EDK57072.1 universal stress family protein [Burkholderia mallei JHU]EDK86704.1 universal stress family protein [Burkholderia mallei 2002721280]EDO88968.1 universal stress family protein [Burkholderia pseudomallei 406e]EDS82134.1 universal stress family protein [Burkholderia pseudomallei S13]
MFQTSVGSCRSAGGRTSGAVQVYYGVAARGAGGAGRYAGRAQKIRRVRSKPEKSGAAFTSPRRFAAPSSVVVYFVKGRRQTRSAERPIFSQPHHGDIMYQRILVAVDGSETARHAFDAALDIARTSGAELQPFYVVENAAIYYNVPGYDPSILRTQLLQQGNELAKEFAEKMQAAGVKGALKIGEATSLADVPSLIVEGAKAFGADLLVLGTHGRRGFKRLVLGSVAEQCVRHSALPVLLIPAAAHPEDRES